MKIKELDEDSRALWDSYVYEKIDCGMYHLSGWKDLLAAEFGFDPIFLQAIDETGKIKGILPLFLMKNILGKKFLISNPFSNYAGLYAENEEALGELKEYATEIAKKEKVSYIEYRHLGKRVFPDLPAKNSFVNFMLELSDIDSMWRGLSSRNRGKVRKAERSGLVPDIGHNYLPSFYEIFTKNLKRLGTPVFGLSFFEKLLETFPENADIFVLNLNGKIVSSMFIFKYKDVISEPWVASLTDYNKIYVNNFLYWKAIIFARENGFRFFDFGRSTKDTGTYKFKEQWGAKPIPLFYEYFLSRASKIPKVDAVDNRYQILINLWKRLPLSFTNFIGPRVVKYLPEL